VTPAKNSERCPCLLVRILPADLPRHDIAELLKRDLPIRSLVQLCHATLNQLPNTTTLFFVFCMIPYYVVQSAPFLLGTAPNAIRANQPYDTSHYAQIQHTTCYALP
jgi:hypothetical protein